MKSLLKISSALVLVIVVLNFIKLGYGYYLQSSLQKDMRNSFQATSSFELEEIKKRSSTSYELNIEPDGKYLNVTKHESGLEVVSVIEFHKEVKAMALESIIIYSNEVQDTLRDQRFKVEANYEIQGAIIRVSNVTGDKGLINSDGIIVDSINGNGIVILSIKNEGLEVRRVFNKIERDISFFVE